MVPGFHEQREDPISRIDNHAPRRGDVAPSGGRFDDVTAGQKLVGAALIDLLVVDLSDVSVELNNPFG